MGIHPSILAELRVIGVPIACLRQQLVRIDATDLTYLLARPDEIAKVRDILTRLGVASVIPP
jgi:hypothetical protein